MKQRCGRFGVIVGIMLFSARPATADPILITGGYLDMVSTTGSLLIQGDDNFTLSAAVSATDGVFQPWLQCRLTPSCVPGAMLDLGARWVGNSLRNATATLHGETFTDVGGLTSTAGAAVNFTGSAIAPMFVGDTATIIAPFRFQGEFSHLTSAFQRVVESLTGEGTVTLQLQRNATLGAWNYTSARYDFEPIPEPATVLLTAAGITTLMVRRLQRRRTNGLRA
jgi:hypothetical protein